MVTVKTIRATSRASVCIRNKYGKDNYYTLEYCEERALSDDMSAAEIEEARAELWNTVNAEVDNQIEDVVNATKNS